MSPKPRFDAQLDELARPDRRAARSERAEIDRMCREEGVVGRRVNASPKTQQALREIGECTMWADVQAMASANRAWRIRRGETCEHEL